MKFKINLLLFAFVMTHCRTLNNEANEIALQCGVTANDIKKYKFVKLINYDGSEIEGKELSALEGIISIDASGSYSPVNITAKACVEVPNVPGTVHVRNPVRSSTVSFLVQDLSKQPDFETYNMIYYSGLKFRVSCDWPDPYTDLAFKIPMEINFLDDPGSLGLSITLQSVDRESLRSLYYKQIGGLELNLPESYSLENIPKGRYMVVVEGRHIGDKISGPFQKLSPDYCVINLK